MTDAADMTVDQFRQHLARVRDEVINFDRDDPGKNNRSYINKNSGSLFVSNSVKIAMRRRQSK